MMRIANPKMIVYEDASGAWRWRLVASNGRTVADSAEAYSSKTKAYNAADRLYEIAGDAAMIVEDGRGK